MTRHDFSKNGLMMVLIGLCLLLTGWTDSWQSIRSAATQVDSVRARFLQTKHMKILAKPLTSEGVFYYQGPDSLRWEYRQPQKSVLLMHEGVLTRYVMGADGYREDTGPALAMMAHVMDEMTHWLNGRFQDNPYFRAALKPTGVIELVPRQEAFAKMIQKIVLTLSQRPGVIKAVKIVENDDSYTQFVFESVVINQRLDDSLFIIH